MSPHSLTEEQREQILTDEINRRTRDGKAEFLAARAGKAYFATNGGVSKWWPARLALDFLWVLAVLVIGVIIHPVIGIIAFVVAAWWARRVAPTMQVVSVGDRGNLTVDTLLWGHAYKMERALEARSRS